jgi:hypothetical protein
VELTRTPAQATEEPDGIPGYPAQHAGVRAGEQQVQGRRRSIRRGWPGRIADGVWHAILTALQARADDAGLITWDVSVDSTVTRAHQHAAGAQHDPSAQAEPPVGRLTTLWVARAVGSPASCTWPVSRARS